MYLQGPARRSGRSGGAVTAAVLLWVFVGWPMSWALFFLFVPIGLLFGVGITIGLIVFLATGSRPVAPTVIAPYPPRAPARHETLRREIEGLAEVNAIGGCGWCGSLAAHVNDAGYQVHPRHWHAAEIEERFRARLRL